MKLYYCSKTKRGPIEVNIKSSTDVKKIESRKDFRRWRGGSSNILEKKFKGKK